MVEGRRRVRIGKRDIGTESRGETGCSVWKEKQDGGQSMLQLHGLYRSCTDHYTQEIAHNPVILLGLLTTIVGIRSRLN